MSQVRTSGGQLTDALLKLLRLENTMKGKNLIRLGLGLTAMVILAAALPAAARGSSGGSGGCSGKGGASFNVTSNLLGTDTNPPGTLPSPFQLLSDGKGAYTTYKNSRTDSVTSEIQGNTCDWVLDLSSSQSRTLQLSLGFPLSTGESLPPGWPTDGSLVSIPALYMTNCARNTANGTTSVGNMTYVGQTLQCGLHVTFNASNSVQYSLRMNASTFPGATWGQVTCQGVGSDGFCNSWTITPGVDANGFAATNPSTGQPSAIGELVLPSCNGCVSGTSLGLYYVNFSTAITKP
jgi:hypothetical protein